MKQVEALLLKHDVIITHEGSTNKDGNVVPLVLSTLDVIERCFNEYAAKLNKDKENDTR